MYATRKRVSVTFVDDDSVIEHIVPTSGVKSYVPGSEAIKKIKHSKTEKIKSEHEESKENAPDDEGLRRTKGHRIEEDIAGNEVFGFRTPKKSGSASVGNTPKSTKSALKKTSKYGMQTPKGKRKAKKVEASTPFRLRSRNQNEEGSSDESPVATDSEEESDAKPTQDEAATSSNTEPVKSKTRRRKGQEDTMESVDSAEQYFDAQSLASLTSDHTLARLETPRMDQEELRKLLDGVKLGYEDLRAVLHNDYTKMFRKWMYFMGKNYNVLLHGLGSKRNLIEEFRTTVLSDCNHLVVNGYFPDISVKHILNCITEEILEQSGSFKSLLDQCDFIQKHIESIGDLYLVIHNIDGSMLRSQKAQTVLGHLASISGVHIIASIDHINAPLIWDQNRASAYNWLWYDVTTYQSYTEETSYENSLLVQQSSGLALSSLTHVMRSLTPNARGIFLLLARYQLDHKDNQNYTGLAFPDLYQRCREAFLVNSDLTLRTQLTEFRDHKLIQEKKVDGIGYLTIPLDSGTIKEFLDMNQDV